MAPFIDPPASDHPCKKKDRFEEKEEVVEVEEGVNEDEEEESKNVEQSNCYLTLVDRGDNDPCPFVIRSMLARSVAIPPFLFSPSETVQPQKGYSVSSVMSSRPLQSPVGSFPEIYPIRSGGCLDIINSALECVETSEPNDQ